MRRNLRDVSSYVTPVAILLFAVRLKITGCCIRWGVCCLMWLGYLLSYTVQYFSPTPPPPHYSLPSLSGCSRHFHTLPCIFVVVADIWYMIRSRGVSFMLAFIATWYVVFWLFSVNSFFVVHS